MQLKWLSLLGLIFGTAFVRSTPRNDVFTSSFLVRFHRNIDDLEAHTVAARNGFENLGAVSTNIFCLVVYIQIIKNYRPHILSSESGPI